MGPSHTKLINFIWSADITSTRMLIKKRTESRNMSIMMTEMINTPDSLCSPSLERINVCVEASFAAFFYFFEREISNIAFCMIMWAASVFTASKPVSMYKLQTQNMQTNQTTLAHFRSSCTQMRH